MGEDQSKNAKSLDDSDIIPLPEGIGNIAKKQREKNNRNSLSRRIKSEDLRIRQRAIEKIKNLKRGSGREKISKSEIDNFLPLLKDPDPEIKAAASIVVGKFKSRTAIYLLAECFNDSRESFSVRREAIWAIAQISAEYPDAGRQVIETIKKVGKNSISMIAKLLGDEDVKVRDYVVELLTTIMDSTDLIVVPMLLKKNDENTRAGAAVLLGKFLAQAESVEPKWIEHLIVCLKDAHWVVRKAAVEALWEIGERATIAAPSLLSALGDAYFPVRKVACYALGKIKAQKAVPPLLKLIAHPQEISAVKEAAAYALAQIKSKTSAVRAAIIEFLQDPTLREQDFLIEYLLEAFAHAASAMDIPILEEMLQSSGTHARVAIAVRKAMIEIREADSGPGWYDEDKKTQ